VDCALFVLAAREILMRSNEEIVREAYAAAEVPVDIEKFIGLFAKEGYLYDVSAGRKYVGREVGDLVKNVLVSFPDMHRELLTFYALGDVIVVELTLNGTHHGPVETAIGRLPPTGRRIEVPCCDIWVVKEGKIRSFHCYTAATILIDQLREDPAGATTASS
jgi:ketosteroid isomerase-like protein